MQPSTPQPDGRADPRRLLLPAAVLLAVFAVGAAWRWTPLGEWLTLDALASVARRIDEAPYTPVLVMLAYVLAGLLVLPLVLLIGVTGLAFGPWWGFVYAMAGALASAAVLYAAGRWLGRERVLRFGGARLNRLSERLASRGVLAMSLIRLVPFAPYTVVNLLAGASHLSFRDYLVGTAIGLTPGTAMMVAFVDRLAVAVRDPEPQTVLLASAIAVAMLVVGWVARRRVLARRASTRRIAGGR